MKKRPIAVPKEEIPHQDDCLLAPNVPTLIGVDEGKPGGDKTVEAHGHVEDGKLVIDRLVESELSPAEEALESREEYLAYINATPTLLSLLYELDLLPEQVEAGSDDDERMLKIADHWNCEAITRGVIDDADRRDAARYRMFRVCGFEDDFDAYDAEGMDVELDRRIAEAVSRIPCGINPQTPAPTLEAALGPSTHTENNSGPTDTERLDWMEARAWSPTGEAIALAVFPFTRTPHEAVPSSLVRPGGKRVALADVFDDGDGMEEFAEAATLREVIDVAMQCNTKVHGK